MYRLLLVGLENENFKRIVNALQAHGGVALSHADSGAGALAGLKAKTADLVVAAEQLTDMSGLAFAEKLVVQAPMVNCALVSSLGDKAFHDASEGLGILAKLPVNPGPVHAVELMQKLKTVLEPGQ